MSPRGSMRRTGKPLGRPPGTIPLMSRHPAWLKTQDNYLLLIHWLASDLPRRLILKYCEEAGIKVPGSALGLQLQALATFSKNRKDDILFAHDSLRALAVGDAVQKREAFLAEQYAARAMLKEHMMTDRDNSGRTHMVREFIHISSQIIEMEGFKKGSFDPKQDRALKMLTDYMFGDKDATPPVDAEVTVLPSPELPPSQPGSTEGASV